MRGPGRIGGLDGMDGSKGWETRWGLGNRRRGRASPGPASCRARGRCRLVQLLAGPLVGRRVGHVGEEPVLPARTAAAGQLVGVGRRVVVDGDCPDELVRPVEAAAVIDVVDARGIGTPRLPLGQDRLQRQVVGEAAGVEVGVAGDEDVAAGVAGNRVLALAADQDTAAGAADDRVGPAPPMRMLPCELPVRVLPPWPPRTLRMLTIPPPTPVAVPAARLTVTGVVYAA